MKYIVWISSFVVLASCSHVMLDSEPVEGKQAQQGKQLSNQTMDHKKNFFVARQGIKGGYVFIFHIMPAPEGEGYSRRNYHLMVSIEKDNQPVNGLSMSSRVKHPNGMVEEDASMVSVGDWYMSLYNLDHEKGRHWVSVSFEQAGKTYSTGIYYPERAYHQ